jgi:single-stranded DNA-binding protein
MDIRNDFQVNIKGRLNKALEIRHMADGQRYTLFEIAPSDEINSDDTVLCVAFNTRAELLERFVSRGDILSVSGFIGPVDFLTEDGRHFKRGNLITAEGIDFPKDAGTDNKASA